MREISFAGTSLTLYVGDTPLVIDVRSDSALPVGVAEIRYTDGSVMLRLTNIEAWPAWRVRARRALKWIRYRGWRYGGRS